VELVRSNLRHLSATLLCALQAAWQLSSEAESGNLLSLSLSRTHLHECMLCEEFLEVTARRIHVQCHASSPHRPPASSPHRPTLTVHGLVASPATPCCRETSLRDFASMLCESPVMVRPSPRHTHQRAAACKRRQIAAQSAIRTARRLRLRNHTQCP
jgi:hypothetical protein